ncbi:mitochondrial ribosomal death-associated protein 3-domain-containing protein [Neohortaea acidophila]|uniref:Small ribosomal subunit protein mS29 n=1 Tax=Neohortaea acidophila TaxID=245834 RepID=A0A6A6PLS5_9PEZI|nr:mitochondrial ribosomal death-associated protein 3-domain-containing protein [Neohortaea acidophila]KAF2481030.1 mitochondrial ribosomal death-associated protein 3-domain-containing protein [Neohortaea acidophila]
MLLAQAITQMAPPQCLRCLRNSLQLVEHRSLIQPPTRAAFSTTSLLSAKAAQPRKTAGTSNKSKTLRLSKNIRQTAGKPPARGERKAVRKRIVLSNTNALEVDGLQDLTADKLARHSEGTVALQTFTGQVLGFSDETVDALRALESFKPTQAWSLFRRPASLVRKETAALANDMADTETDTSKVARKMVFGEKGSGKSVLLLQAHAMAFVKDWIVVHFPEGQDLTIAHSAYEPLRTPNGRIYVQPQYTAKLLLSIANANQALLSSLQLSRDHQLPFSVQSNMSLFRFAELGGRDPTIAWPIWQALWAELLTPATKAVQRPPVLVTMDGADQVMRVSAYLDPEAKPVHAHDLALVRDFANLLSGRTQLPNGGMVLAATCASNRAASPTLDYCLSRTYIKQEKASNAWHLLPLRGPSWDPYQLKDARVESAVMNVSALKLQGLSKDEARGVLEYYAKSGVLMNAVTDGFVSEKWSLAGHGVIGELEKGTVRMRF